VKYSDSVKLEPRGLYSTVTPYWQVHCSQIILSTTSHLAPDRSQFWWT